MIIPRARRLASLLIPAMLLWLAGCADEGRGLNEFASVEPAAIAELALKLDGGDERAVVFANANGGFYYGAAASPQHDEAMGFIHGGFRMLDGWHWWFPADSVGLGLADVRSAVVRPDLVARRYVETDTSGFLARLVGRFRGAATQHLTEVVTLGDGGVVITVPDSSGTVEFMPAFSDRASDGYTTQAMGDVLIVARSNYMEARGDDPRPVWVAIAGSGARARTGSVDLAQRFAASVGERSRASAPGRLRIDTPGTLGIATGMTQEEAAANARALVENADAARQQRQRRVLRGLDAVAITTEDDHFNKAYRWARVMMEDLVREDSVSADFLPGIPGRVAARGWNTLQTMEGAFLATGQWQRAANMLRLYSRNQRFDRRIDIFGRAPARFDHRGRPEFNTGDAQVQLVASLGDYLRTTGHDGLVLGERRLFWTNPVYVQRGLDDTGQLRSQSGLIRSAPGQTWLRSPEERGPDAVEVQGRYLENLRTMERLAMIMGVRRQAEAYADSARVFQQRFERELLRNDELVDYLDGNRQQAQVARPSGLFALRSVDLGHERERAILRNIAERFAFSHGVATRVQSDTTFYPFLDEPDHYEPEAARYDGTVWTALSGPLISLLAEHGAVDRAHEQFRTLEQYVIDHGVVGGIAENADAHPREAGGRVGVGGAPVQPWSLAEFVRVAHQDLVGVRYAAGNTVILQPRIPSSWGTTRTAFRMGQGMVRVTIEQSGREVAVSLVPEGAVPATGAVHVRAFGNEVRVPLASTSTADGARPADSVRVSISSDRITLNGETVEASARYDEPDASFWDGFSWVEPDLREEYPVMQRLQEERRLTVDQITTDNPTARVIMARTDPVGDDWGTTATYTYPLNYPPRILDAIYLEIAEDPDATYFRIEMAALADDDDFGFQPTFFAIAISTEEGGQEQVGRNAQYRFQRGRGYNYIIFVGDGILVEDERGRVLGQFDALGDQLFDPDAGNMRFALPQFVLPSLPRNAEITLMVGANDGSRPPGRFRTVGPTATQQYGGGKVNHRDPNIYDFITGRISR